MLIPFKKYKTNDKQRMVETATEHLLAQLKENRYSYDMCKEIAEKLSKRIDQDKEEITDLHFGKPYQS